MMLVPQPMNAWYLTPEGRKRIWVIVQTIELAPGCWRAHLEAVFEAAEGRTVGALERQKE